MKRACMQPAQGRNNIPPLRLRSAKEHMKHLNDCKQCSIRGYSPEICSLHHKMMPDGDGEPCERWWDFDLSHKKIGKTLALGACAGILTSALGVSAACFIGLKGLCETLIAAKLVAGGGMAGAMAGVAIKKGEDADAAKLSKKRKHFVPPMYLTER